MGSEGEECKICFMPYTSGVTHRIVSLKCGHIFGKSCIEKWMQTVRPAHCPFCFSACRKPHLRELFITSVSVTDTTREEELIRRFNEERNLRIDAEKRLSMVKAELDIARLERVTPQNEEKKQTFVPHTSNPIDCSLKNPIDFILDFVTNKSCFFFIESMASLIYSANVNGRHVLRCYRFTENKEHHAINLTSRMKSVAAPREFNTELILILEDGAYFLIWDECFAFALERIPLKRAGLNQKPVSLAACCFDLNYESNSIFYIVDVLGNIYLKCRENDSEKVIDSGQKNVHTAYHRNDGKLLVGGVFGLSIIDPATGIYQKIDGKPGETCTSVSSDGDNTVMLYRTPGGHMQFETHGKKTIRGYMEVNQMKRYPNKLYCGYLYVVCDSGTKLRVISMDNLLICHEYDLKDEILDFFIDETFTYIICKQKVYMYGSS